VSKDVKQTKQNRSPGEVLLPHAANRLHRNSGLQEIQVHQHRDTRDEVSLAELQRDADRPLVACSLWLHIGFIGAAALAAGLLQLFDGETAWLSALALAISGAVLAAASWRHALTILEDAERASSSAGAAPGESALRASSRHAVRRMSSPISAAIGPKGR
jgi:hypothetical protein